VVWLGLPDWLRGFEQQLDCTTIHSGAPHYQTQDRVIDQRV
jgi:hypothetical protein